MKMIQKTLILMIILGLQSTAAPAQNLGPAESSQAFTQYSRRPSTELSKLIYLIDRFKETDFYVLYDGYEYTAIEAARYAKKFLAKNYKSGTADSWIKKHCYRTTSGGNVIYLKDNASGDLKPLKEILLTELEHLHKIAARK